MPFLTNAWYVAALSSEVERGAMAKRVLVGRPMVVVRSEEGVPALFEDRCPHRFAPLSMGSLCGSSIECGYHGMRFAFDGRCVENPTQPEQALPDRVHVRTYPRSEEHTSELQSLMRNSYAVF